MKRYLTPLAALCVLAAMAAPIQSIAAPRHAANVAITSKIALATHHRHRKHHRRHHHMVKHMMSH